MTYLRGDRVEADMSTESGPETRSIYEWLCCPNCDSREIVRGPRNERGAVQIRCDDCGTAGWVGL
jgi:predicted RNA-binding Zn-ribbon protein involved in translation (DUF1610 family)